MAETTMSPIVIPIVTKMPNVDESLQDIHKLNEGIDLLKTSLDTIRNNNQKSILPGFEEDLDRQLSLAEKSVEQLTKLRDTAVNAEGPEASAQARRNYEQAYKRAQTTAIDLAESVKSSHAVTYDIEGTVSSYMEKAMKAEMPAMRKALRGVAQNLAMSGNVGDDYILEVFENTPAFKQTLGRLQAGNSGVTKQMLQQVSRAILPTSVPQYLRNNYLAWDRGDYKAPQTVRDRLPSSFGRISLSRNPEYRAFNASAEALTADEVRKLEKIVRDNPYMSQEFEKADIIRKYNGQMFMNPNVNRSHVSALGGLAARLFEAGIRGGPNTGIQHIEHPETEKQLESMLHKTNLSTSNSERLARSLQASFDWFTPEHVSVPKAERGDISWWKHMGAVNATPRETAAHFLEFSLRNIGKNGQIQYQDGERAEYLRTPYNLAHKELSRLNGADQFEHNGYNSNAIYLKLPIDEMGDYETSAERKLQIKKQLSNAFGTQITGPDGHQYVFGNLTPSHAMYVRKDLYDQEMGIDKNFFWNGESRREFDNFEDFGRAIENAKKIHTQGEDIESLYGTDLRKANVVVTDMKKLRDEVLTGLDGQNFISSRLVPKSFQGRDFSGKSTFSVFDLDKLWEMYPQFVDQESGDLVFPTGGINGGQLRIPKGTDILEDYSNIKAKHQYTGMTQEELNAARSAEVRDRGILAKATTEDFATSAKYISAQAAATMQLNPGVRDFFRKEFVNRLDSLNNISAVKELLFSGDDALSQMVKDDEGYLALPEAQQRINEYRRSLIANVGAGKLLVPQGKAKYGMISAWLPDVISNLVPQDQLTAEQKSWKLGGDSDLAHQVAYFANLSDELMLFRNPSTLSGNIQAKNKAAGSVTFKGAEQSFQQFAEMLKVDPEALYVDPKKEILKLMQGADEDGDTAFVTALRRYDKEGNLKTDYNTDFANIMSYLVEDTVTRYKKMREQSGRTDEQQEAINAAHTVPANQAKSLYRLGGDYADAADFVEGFAEQGAAMGFANTVSVNGSQWRPSQNVINGILDAEAHYDVDSNGRIKYNRKWVATDNEWDLLLGGAPLYQMYNWANKDLSEDRTKYNEVESGPDYAAFAKRRIDAVNFPTRYDTHGITTAQQLYYLNHTRPDVELPYDWDYIFSTLPNEYQDMPHVNKWIERTRELKKGQLKGEFYGIDDSVATELSVLSANAFGELLRSGKEPKDIRKAALQLGLGDKFMNGRIPGIAENIKTSGLLRSFIESDPEMLEEVQALSNISGAASMYATTAEIPAMAYLAGEDARDALKRQHNDNAKKIREAQQAKKEAQQAVATADKEIAQLSKDEKMTPRQLMISMLDEALPIENGNSWSQTVKGQRSKKAIAAKVAETLGVPFGGGALPTTATVNDFLKKRGLNENASQTDIESAVLSLLGDTSVKEKASGAKASKLKEAQQRRSDALKQMEENEATIHALDEENHQIAATQQKFEKSYEVGSKFDRIIGDVKAFNTESFKNFRKEEDKINGVSSAESYYNLRKALADRHAKNLDSFTAEEKAELTDEDINELNKQRRFLYDNLDREFSDRGLAAGKDAVDKINTLLGKKTGGLSKQGEIVKNAQDTIDFLTGYADMYDRLASSKDDSISNTSKERYQKASGELRKNVKTIQEGRQTLIDTFTSENEEAAKLGIENLEIQAGLRKKNSVSVRSAARIRGINAQRKTIQNQYNEGHFSQQEYESAMASLDKLEKRSSEASIQLQDMGKAALSGITAPMKMLANQLERQIFQSAIKEVRRFVTDYNKSMTEIQMITLKSDTQIQDLGKNLINTAKEMKISVSEVTNSAATLYRQGLSDEEVSDRLEVISKFSKVSGTKVDAATKLITVAMNTGLVDNATTAADIVTALGDSAATNASEIEKGIEKAGAAAAADGTTFGQLAAMLTAITSTTQIGGNVAGRTLNTIIGRMNKIGTNELIYDENGNAISGSAVAQLLQAQGINMYDANGNKRSTFDTLYALSQRWEGMKDAEQQQIANAIAGTRQYSNFAAIMQGMSEGDIDRYLDLIGESSGITDKKFEVYAKSLEASVTNLRNTFDGLVNDLTDSGALTGFIDGLASAIQGVDNLANGISNLTGGMGGLAALVPTVLPMLAGLALLKAGVATANLPMVLAGLAAAGVGYGIASIAGSYTPAKSSSEIYAEQKASSLSRYNDLDSKLTRATELNNKSDRTEAEDTEFKSLLKDISLFNTLSGALDSATTSAEGLAASIDGMASSANDATAAIKAAKDENDKQLASDIIKGVGPQAEGIVSSVNAGMQSFGQTARSSISGMNGVLWTIDEAGNMQLLSQAEIQQGLGKLTTSPEGNQKIRNLASFLATEATQANGFNVPEPFKGYDTDAWQLVLQDIGWGFGETQGIDQRFWQDVLDYAIGTYTSADDPKNVLRQQLQESLQSSLSGIVPENQIAGAVGYVTDRVLASAADGQITKEIIANALNDLYGIDLQNPDSYQLASIQQSAQQKAWTWQQYDAYVRGNQALANKQGQVIPPLDFETWRRIEKPELRYSEQSVANEPTQAEELAKDIFGQATISYLDWQQDSKNAYALLADNMYRAIRGSNITNAKELNDYIKTNGLTADFNRLYSNNEFGRLMAQVQRDKNGNIVYAPEDIVDQVMSFLAGNGLTYGAPNLTVAQRGQRALAAYNGLQNMGWYTSQEEKEEAIRLASIRYANAKTDQEKESIATEITGMRMRGALTPNEQNYLKEALGESLYQDFISGNAGFGVNELVQQILTNRANGYTDFTTQQKLNNIDAIRAIAKQNELDFSNEEYLLQMLSGFSGAQEWINLQKIKGTEDYEDLGGDARLTALERELDTYVQELMQSDAATALAGINGFSKSLSETALKNRGILETGNAAERLGVYSGFRTDVSAAQNAQYYLDNRSAQSASVLASYLGLSETDVKQSLQTDAGKQELQNAINAQVTQMYASMAAALNVDLGDFNVETGTLTELRAQLLSQLDVAVANGNEALATLLRSWVNTIEAATGHLTGQTTSTFSDMFDSTIDNLNQQVYDEQAIRFLAQNAAGIKEAANRADVSFTDVLGGYTDGQGKYRGPYEGWNSDWESALLNNSTAVALMDMFLNGPMNLDQFTGALNGMLSPAGPGFDYYNTLGQTLYGGMVGQGMYGDYQYGGANLFNANGTITLPDFSKLPDESKVQVLQGIGKAIDEIGSASNSSKTLFDEYTRQFDTFNNVIDAFQSGDYEKIVNAVNAFNEQVNEKRTQNLTKYSKASTDYAAAMSKINSADQKSRAAGQAALEKIGRDRKDQNTALRNAKNKDGSYKSGKSLSDATRKLIAAQIDGVDENQIKDWSAKQMKEKIEGGNLAGALAQSMVDELNAGMADYVSSRTGIPFDMSQLKVTPDGKIDLSELEAQFGSDAEAIANAIQTFFETLGALYGTAEFDTDAEGNVIVVSAEVDFNKGGGYSAGGAGGGGGGGGGSEKSPAQQLLDKQKHETTEAQHAVKMQEIYQTHYDFVNDYDSYISSLGLEEEAYNNLSAMYQRHIGELESMLGGLEAYSDDWWSVKEALDAAKESLADVQNKIDAIETKRVEIIVQKQENEDKPSTQKQGLWTEKARSYQIRGQFESYAVSEGKRIEEIGEQRKLNETQIAELEKTLAQTTEGSDAWLQARDQIWALQLENAQLANDQEEARRALQVATVEQAQTDLTNRMTPRTHETNMLQTYSQLYQNNRQYEDYRNNLMQQNDVSRESVDLYTQYRDKLTEQMKTLEEGSEAWYAARDAIFEYDEAIAQATLSIDENNRAIEQNKIDELKKDYENLNKDIAHTDNILKTQQDRYDQNNNFTMYQTVLAERIGVTTNKIFELEKQLQGYLDLQNQITEDTDAWDELKESAQSTAESVETAKSELEELQRLQSQSKFEHDQEIFERQDDLDQHTLRMIQYEESMYQNRGEYRNQNIILQRENELRAEMAQHEREYIDILKEDLALTQEGSDEYYNIADAIYKAEENVKQHTNAIEKNTETMKKNEEQILKTYQTLINTIDTEIKQRVKEQREQLSAEVSIQNQILNVIRNRYKQEWQLVKADIAEKKKALQQEKALINERLQTRIQAEDTESRYAELSELQRQLTLIASDPTRTKDAKALQKQIEDMEKELSRTHAQEEAKAEQERLDEEMKAYDQYVAYQEASLNQMLKDANSVPLYEELNAAMGTEDMSREDRIANYLDWLRQNDDNYKYGTEALRMQMEQSSTDSWNKMLGWIDTYWDQVHDIIDGGIDTILDYMKESRSYRFGEEEATQKLLEWTWKEQFENYVDSQKNDAEWNHTHEDIVTDIQDEVFEINRGITDMYGLQKDLYHFIVGLQYDYIRPTDVDPDADKIDYKDYAGIGKKAVTTAPISVADTGGTTKDKATGATLRKYKVKIEGMGEVEIYASSEQDAITKAMGKNWTGSVYLNGEHRLVNKGTLESTKEYQARIAEAEKKAAGLRNKSTVEKIISSTKEITAKAKDYIQDIVESIKSRFGFSEGGEVNFTGLAMVHGSPQKPEAFLSSDDRANMRAMLDAFQYIKTPSAMIPSDKAFTGNYNVGDVNITINEAQINNDADLDRLATEIGRKFTKQLSKEGLNLTGYSW